jgi:hypothetical protein
MSTLPLADPALMPAAPPPAPPVAPAAVPPAEPATELEPREPAVVFEVVSVDCVALVLWFVVAFGLTVTLLCGIALKFASVFTDVLALGFTDCAAVLLVLLPAWLVVLCAAAAAVLSAAKTAAAMTLTDCSRFIRRSPLERKLPHVRCSFYARVFRVLPLGDSGKNTRKNATLRTCEPPLFRLDLCRANHLRVAPEVASINLRNSAGPLPSGV